MPWQASPELTALGGLARSRLHTYYEAARAEAMVDVDVADQRYQALYGTPYEHGRSDERSNQRWQILAERATPSPERRPSGARSWRARPPRPGQACGKSKTA